MESKDILARLRSMESPRDREGMARFGINPNNTLGVSIYKLRPMATEIRRSCDDCHSLAQELWASGIHEARILAVFVDDPKLVTEKQMDSWAKDFDSWDVCDQACTSLFDQSPLAWKTVKKWAARDEEFVKRGAFALIAGLAWHNKKAKDSDFDGFFPIIKRASTDERNYIRKAVNWALRNIGKRNLNLNRKAISCAKEIQKLDSKAARWIAADALRELQSEAKQEMLKSKEK